METASLVISIVATIVSVFGIVTLFIYIADRPAEFTPEELASIREQIADAEFDNLSIDQSERSMDDQQDDSDMSK